LRRLAALGLGLVVAAGCGGGGGTQKEAAPSATVFAASSLTEVFQRIAPRDRFSFAGSDQLAAQIQEGAPADVFAAASPKYPDALHDDGLVATPRPFATNSLVVVVPSDNPAGITRVADLAKSGVRVVVGAEGVPLGDYTRDVLERLGREDVLGNVVSNEEDAKSVIAKIVSGDADAAFVYVTDAKAAGGDVRTIAIPESAEPTATYEIATVANAPHPVAARRFVRLVLSARGRAALEAAGFGLP